MFSSLASFIFGSNTPATTNQEPEKQQQEQQQQQENVVDTENTIEVTASTPSVTGASGNNLARPNHYNNNNKRGKNRRSKNNRNSNNNRRQGQQQQQKPPSITTLLTPSDAFDEELDEDDWFIVEKEDEEESLPRTDSEEELSIVEVKPKPAAAPANAPTTAAAAAAAQRRRHHINSHSLYSGPRPQQQRNHLQRSRASGTRGAPLSVSTLSPPRSVAGAGVAAIAAAAAADGGITQSLYVVSPSGNGAALANVSMEESWFVTPPPCFTSIGPINMESSPFENLLIEHPSMSVYHSIRSAQEATESFVNLDLGLEESQQAAAAAKQKQEQQQQQQQQQQQTANSQVVQKRAVAARLDRYSAAQLKQEILARSTQKSHDKKDRQSLCRGAIKRANKVRDFQSNGNRQRRADQQHCKVVSGANNNRKCCY